MCMGKAGSSLTIFRALPTDYSQLLPPYPTESESYLYTFILDSLLIIFHDRYMYISNYNRFASLII